MADQDDVVPLSDSNHASDIEEFASKSTIKLLNDESGERTESAAKDPSTREAPKSPLLNGIIDDGNITKVEAHKETLNDSSSDTEHLLITPTPREGTKFPLNELTGSGKPTTKATATAAAGPTSKLDTLPREHLLALLKKQAFASKESKKQAEEYQERIKSLEEKCKNLEEKIGNDSGSEMMSMELDDYKNSCAELKKQLENQKEGQKQKDEMVRDLSTRSDKLLQEKEEALQQFKEAKTLAAKLQKDLDEQQTILSENSKEAQSLTLQSQQIRAECDLEIAKLNMQLKRFREESMDQQRYVTEKTSEVRRLKSDLESLQQSYDNLKNEHSTFKERAEYVLKQKNDEQLSKEASLSSSSSGKMEIDELIRSLNSRNDKITQLTERCSYLEDELRSSQDYAKNIKGELEDAQHSLNSLRTRGLEERRRAESDYEFRLRQAYTDKEILQKNLNRTVEQATEDKNRLIESFNRQNAELEEKNRELMQKMEEYRNLAASQPASSTTPRALTPIRIPRRQKFPQPINFAHESHSIVTSPMSNGPITNPPGLDHDNDEDDLRSLQDVINDASDDQMTVNGGGGPRPISAFDDLASRPSIDFYTIEEYEAIEKQLSHTRELLNDMEDTNSKLVEQIKILKEEIRRLERNVEREQHTSKNSEYLKNVVMKFLSPPKVNDERQQLLPVLITMLRLSPEEVTSINDYIKESSFSSTGEDNPGWTSFLWSNIV